MFDFKDLLKNADKITSANCAELIVCMINRRMQDYFNSYSKSEMNWKYHVFLPVNECYQWSKPTDNEGHWFW